MFKTLLRCLCAHRTNRSLTDELALSVEKLEDRQMLAGQVRVIVNGNDIRVLGDGAGNDVEIGDVGGQIRVFSSNNTTNIVNGNTGVSSANLGTLRILMRGGDDSVRILDGVEVGGSLDIRTAGGFDFVRMHGGHIVNGPTAIRTGGGNDNFYVADTDFEGAFRLVTGGGNDFVFLGESDDTINFDRTVTVSMGGGSDAFELNDFSFVYFDAANNQLKRWRRF